MDQRDREHYSSKAELPAHTPGCPRGEELARKKGREPGRDNPRFQRTARDSSSVCSTDPILPIMPHMPPP